MDTMWEKVHTSFWVNLTAQFLEKLQTVENLAYFPQYRISYTFRDTTPHGIGRQMSTVVNWETSEPILKTR